jgi:hypothetical protein
MFWVLQKKKTEKKKTKQKQVLLPFSESLLEFEDSSLSDGPLLGALAVLQEKDRGLEAGFMILLEAGVLRASAVRVL